jgi:predicted tellurium resistance membrane protein TerC
MDAQFWTALLEIVAVNIVLSGDNAIVIALACRSLPARQQRLGVMLGAGAAIVMRVGFTAVAATLMTMPSVGIVGGGLLLWIGWKLLTDEAGGEDDVAAAGAAKGNTLPLILGLVVSVPLVVFGATVLPKLIQHFPVIVTLGAALVGFIAGEVLVVDKLWQAWVDAHAHWLHYAAPAIGAIAVVAAGHLASAKPLPEPGSTAEAVAAPAALFGARALLAALAGLLAARAPWLVSLAASLLGHTAGQKFMGDQGVSGWSDLHAPVPHTIGPILAAVVAVAIV